MTDWEPATEAEVAMRDALRANDQELYFRILARGDLLLPVSADALAGRAPTGWGTWTTGGRTHVLAFTSEAALRTCLADYAGATRRVPYPELAASWPNLDWWLAVNPGLPVEGYLPAWFVSQLGSGDVRLPGRSLGARARLERAETAARARATAAVPGRTFPPAAGQPAAMPGQPPAVPGQPAAMPGRTFPPAAGQPAAVPGQPAAVPDRAVPSEVAAGRSGPAATGARPVPSRSPLAVQPVTGDALRTSTAPHEMRGTESASVAGNQMVAHQTGSAPDPALPIGASGLPRRPVPGGPASRPAAGDPSVRRPGAADASAQSAPVDPASLWRPAMGDASARRPVGRPVQVSAPADVASGGADPRAVPPDAPGDTPPTSWYAAADRRATRQTGTEPVTRPEHVDRGRASGPSAYAAVPTAPVIPGVGPSGSVSSADGITEARPWSVDETSREPTTREQPGTSGVPGSGRTPDGGANLSDLPPARPPSAVAGPDSSLPHRASAAGGTVVEGTWSAGIPSSPVDEPAPAQPHAVFTPANEVEENLLSAAGGGSTDSFLSTLLLARVLLPAAAASPTGARPGDDGFAWRTETLDGETYVVVFTSEERLADHLTGPVETVKVKFVQLIRHWPDVAWSFAVNPGTPVGAKLPGPQIVALATWAADVGLGDDAGESELIEPPAPPEPAPQPTYASTREEPGLPTMMQKTIAPSQAGYYLERGYDRVSGFVHRASEVAHLTTPAKLYAALGLGYPGSPFSRDADDVYVVRWPAYRPSLYRIPYGGQHEAAMRAMEGWVIERAPFRGNGFAPGDSSDVVAEFKVDSVRLPHGSQLWRLHNDGTQTKVATLDSDGPTWRPAGED